MAVAVDADVCAEAEDWGDLTGTIDSVTGELSWDVPGRFAEVRAAATQGIIGFGRGEHTLPDATVKLDTAYATLLLTSLDDAPIATASRVLVTAIARDRESGAAYNADNTNLDKLGGPPLLLEPVIADITLPGAPMARVSALDVDGFPRVEVPVSGDTFTIDGRWKTCWYLVERAVDSGDGGDTDTGGAEDGDTDAISDGCGCATGGGSLQRVAASIAGIALLVVARRRR